jgi:hypothetical protein
MSEANLTAGGGGGVPIRSIAWFPHGTPDDVTIEGARYLKSGFIETDPAKFDAQIWGDTPGLLWTPFASAGIGGGTRRVMDIESNGAGNILIAVCDAVAEQDPRLLRSIDGGSNWTVFSSFVGLTGLGFSSVAYGASKFVIVGEQGKILTSPDGAAWTLRASNVTAGLFSVTFNGSMFVAVGQGVILTSPDGISWLPRTVPAALSGVIITNAEFGNNTWMVADQSGTVATAPADGSVWTLRPTPDISSGLFFDSETALFYAYGHRRAHSSADGLSWLVITTTDGPDNVSSVDTKMLKIGAYFYWVDSRFGALVRSKDLKAASPVYAAQATLTPNYPANPTWVKRLKNGKLLLSYYMGASNSLNLHQGNTAPFAGAVIRTAHDLPDVASSYSQASLPGYSRIS